ncbi:MAG TPA: hypothetical protein VJH04_02110 [archaeon]|nr:hypothetical protein [archaeon]
MCYSNVTFLTTGNFGEWKTEQSGVSAACNNASKDYFLEIGINNVTQGDRRRLTSFSFIRKDVNETSKGALLQVKLIQPVIINTTNYNSTFITPIIANTTIIGNSLTIITPIVNHTVNQSGFTRSILKNIDRGSETSVINTLENDAGYQFSIALTSSNYNLTQQFAGENRSNLGVISLNAPNSIQFLNRWNRPFVWRFAENGTLTPQTESMILGANGNLSITGNFTANNIFSLYLGSLTNRITQLFVQNIDASENITAAYFIGDGRFLVNLPTSDNTTLGNRVGGDNTTQNARISTLESDNITQAALLGQKRNLTDGIFGANVQSSTSWANGGWLLDTNGNIYGQNLFLLVGINSTTIQNQTINGSMTPLISNQFDLGSSSLVYANIYGTSLFANGVNVLTRINSNNNTLSNIQSSDNTTQGNRAGTLETRQTADNTTLANRISSDNTTQNARISTTESNNQTLSDLISSNNNTVYGSLGTKLNLTDLNTFLNLSGTNANQNINVGSYNFTANYGFFSYLGSLTNRITKLSVQEIDVSDNATIEALTIRRYDAFGPVILLNNTAGAIRIFAAPNITNPSNGAGIQLFGNNVGYFPGDVYIDAGSASGAQIIMRTGSSGLNDRVVIEDDGRVRILNLTGSGNDYVCVDANGYIFRSNTAC